MHIKDVHENNMGMGVAIWLIMMEKSSGHETVALYSANSLVSFSLTVSVLSLSIFS